MSWRDRAKPIIAAVIKRVGLSDIRLVKAELREAYPFGPRENHPYKIWCDEVKRQLGLKVVKSKPGKSSKRDEPLAGQSEMFGDDTCN